MNEKKMVTKVVHELDAKDVNTKLNYNPGFCRSFEGFYWFFV